MSEIQWQKSSYSTDGEECVELASAAELVLVRESDGPNTIITSSQANLRAFMLGVKAGDFDHLI